MLLGNLIREIYSFRLRDYHPLRWSFPSSLRLTIDLVTLSLLVSKEISGPATRRRQRLTAIGPLAFGLIPVRSPLLRESLLLSFPGGSKMFQFPPSRLLTLCIQIRIPEVCSGGFPHWEIPGSKPAYGSPGLIAVNHVLHRLLVPRHPPYTLFNLTVSL